MRKSIKNSQIQKNGKEMLNFKKSLDFTGKNRLRPFHKKQFSNDVFNQHLLKEVEKQ